MLTLELSGHDVPLHFTRFPGGEVGVALPPARWQYTNANTKRGVIKLDYQGDQDLISLLMLTDAVRRACPDVILSLVMPYFPYARQDRVCNPREALSAKVIADLINSQNFASVLCYNLHSDVSVALIDRLVHRTMNDLAFQVATGHSKAILVSPDAGANKKVFDFAKTRGFPDVVRADKVRDTLTGEIKETKVYSDHVGDRDFLILDDICDGGRTFVELAKELKKLTTGKIYLYVTHGIFSKGAEVFEGLIDGIYTNNLMGDKHPLIQEI